MLGVAVPVAFRFNVRQGNSSAQLLIVHLIIVPVETHKAFANLHNKKYTPSPNLCCSSFRKEKASQHQKKEKYD
jgi:hypothetical protein